MAKPARQRGEGEATITWGEGVTVPRLRTGRGGLGS